jgi:hypothetical protein
MCSLLPVYDFNTLQQAAITDDTSFRLHRSGPEAYVITGVIVASRHFFSPPALSSAPSCVPATFPHEYRAQTIHFSKLHRSEPEVRLRCRFHTVVAALVISARGSCQAGTEHAAAGMESRSRRQDEKGKYGKWGCGDYIVEDCKPLDLRSVVCC